MNVSALQQQLRASLKQTIRMSVAARKKASHRVEEDLQKLDAGLGRKVNVLSGKKDARMHDIAKEARNINTDQVLQEKPKEEDLSMQEGDNSLFDQNLTMQEDVGLVRPKPAVVVEDAEVVKPEPNAMAFLQDHMSEIERHASEVGLDEKLLAAGDNTLYYGDEDLLDDVALDAFIDQNLENLQNLEVEDIRLDGGVLDLDLNLRLDIPEDLDNELTLQTQGQQKATTSQAASKSDAAGKGSETGRRFVVNPDGTVQTTRIDQ